MSTLILVFFSKMFSAVIGAPNARQCAQDIHASVQPLNENHEPSSWRIGKSLFPYCSKWKPTELGPLIYDLNNYRYIGKLIDC